MTFRQKLLVTHVGLVAVVVGGVVLALNRWLGADLSRRTADRLEEQARGAESWIAQGRNPGRIAQRLSFVVDARVTIVGKDGDVLGDSVWPDAPSVAVDDVRGAPEIAAAQAGRVGRAIRRAARTGVLTQYVAVPMADGRIVRLGVPLTSIEDTLRAVRNRLRWTAAIAVMAALLLALLAAALIARSVRAMTGAAAKIAAGDYDVRLPPTARDELGDLARSLSSLGAQLAARIGDLTAERDRLSAILDGMVEGVVVVGPDGRLVVANPSARRVLGEDPAAHPALAPILGAEGESELALGGAELVVNVRRLAAHGVVAVFHDVTRLRRLEATRRDFVANASHELRTPVHAIQGATETLLGGELPAADRKEFLEIIHRHALRIGRLVEDLLRLSELEARGLAERAAGAVALAPLARRVAETARRRREIAVDVPEGLAARAHEAGLEQVLDNLIDNAIKYGGPRVTLRAARDGARVRVTVRDDGPGIPAEHLPRLFERFYRVDAGRSRDLGGTGLGLAIVKHLVEAMGGAVGVTSAAGEGTTFTVELPAV